MDGPTDSSEEGWTPVSLDPASMNEHVRWARRQLLGGVKGTSTASTNVQSAYIRLESSESFPSNEEVVLADRVVIAREEDDFIYRLLRTDQAAYREIMDSVRSRMDSLLSTGIYEIVREREEERQKWAEMEKSYKKQRVWRRVGNSCGKGMRDQTKDFNVHIPEALPASWTIQGKSYFLTRTFDLTLTLTFMDHTSGWPPCAHR